MAIKTKTGTQREYDEKKRREADQKEIRQEIRPAYHDLWIASALLETTLNERDAEISRVFVEQAQDFIQDALAKL